MNKKMERTLFFIWVLMLVLFRNFIVWLLGEKVGWRWGFGLAGIFMFFGLLQFWFAQNIFGDIGKKPILSEKTSESSSDDEPKFNPFTNIQLLIIGIASILGLAWILNDPISKISEGSYNLFNFNMFGTSGSNAAIFTALALFVLLLAIRIPRYDKITRDRMVAVIFFLL